MSRRRSVGPLCLEQTGTESKASTATEPQNVMYTQQLPQPPAPVLQKPIVRLALKILTQLKPLAAQPHIAPENWNKFRITCNELDLSWKSEYGGSFLRLITHEKMQQFATQYGFDHIQDLRPGGPDPRHPFSNSDKVASNLNDYLFSVNQDDFPSGRSRWKFHRPDDSEASQLRYFPNDEMWQVDYILTVKDGRMPHVNCTLIEAGKLKEDTLMFSEVWSILMLTLNFFRQAQNVKHELVPVTIVTISGMTFRIVQGCIDGKTNSVKIKKSSIVPLGPDKKTVKERMMLIVRWLLAEPVLPLPPKVAGK
ncbi:hypothetical protein F5Y03DRAFT_399084 [Xylaria venustula]|nr:hypothetical protein F5Y03DRAFT_399084 [Xylaria venustula]